MMAAGGAGRPREVQETLAKLDRAEAVLVEVVRLTKGAVERVEETGMGQRVDMEALKEQGGKVVAALEEIHDGISSEIPNLVNYIPFERSSYGEKKDSDIAAQKVDFARQHLTQTLAELERMQQQQQQQQQEGREQEQEQQ